MDLASLILSIVALVLALMALPTVFQMIWGAPKLTFEQHQDERGTRLSIIVRNVSIESRFLLWLKVFRMDARLRCHYAVRDSAGQLVDSGQQAIAFADGKFVQTGVLGEYDWALVRCVTWPENARRPFIGEEDHADAVYLVKGLYIFDLTLDVSGQVVKQSWLFDVFSEGLGWAEPEALNGAKGVTVSSISK